jgi:hypothetical protein
MLDWQIQTRLFGFLGSVLEARRGLRWHVLFIRDLVGSQLG